MPMNLVRRKSEESVLCPFCGVNTQSGKNGRKAHVGRHMEEIAFTIVNTSYQEWDFYSDSSLRSGLEICGKTPTESWHRKSDITYTISRLSGLSHTRPPNHEASPRLSNSFKPRQIMQK